ncbi:NTF2-related export protein [Acrasis kona]|uniref:NTF2-related export protein n=1 Tax=Acrasis kona TaxID=1008807 RepID=A0AAW2YJ93_9EUKA
MSSISEDVIVTASKWGAETFIPNYFRFMDSNRQETLKLYKDWTSIVWNGQKYGAQQYSQILQSLPPTTHDVESIDVQPIETTLSLSSPNLLVIVTGSVTYNNDNSTKRLFTQNFVIFSEQQGYFIASDNFRWIAPCTSRKKNVNMNKR